MTASSSAMLSRRTFYEVLILVRDYSHWSSIHGLRHIVKSGTTFRDRLFWLVLLVACAVVGGHMVRMQWLEYSQVPTETVLTDSAYSLRDVPFPDVTFCPTHKMLRNTSLALLRRYLNEINNESVSDDSEVIPSNVSRADLEGLVLALHTLSYTTMRPAARALKEMESILPSFDFLAVSSFMRKVLPGCTRVFHSCMWKGIPFPCCQEFQVIETERGFCYSVNPGVLNKHLCQSKRSCWWAALSTTGPASGLRVFLFSGRQVPINNMVDLRVKNSLGWVAVNNAVDRANMLAEHPIYRVPGGTFSLALQCAIAVSTPELRQLDTRIRKCRFPDEWPATLLPWKVVDSGYGMEPGQTGWSGYTMKSCYHLCRRRHIFNKCGCLPYPFFLTAGGSVECNLSQLTSCLSDISEWLWFYSPPADTPGFSPTEFDRALNCSECIPSCRSHEYTVSSTSTLLASGLPRVLLDIYFEGPNAATLYTILPSVTATEFLVSIGGIGSLFLGISCISALEICVLLLKCCWVLIFGKPTIFKRNIVEVQRVTN